MAMVIFFYHHIVNKYLLIYGIKIFCQTHNLFEDCSHGAKRQPLPIARMLMMRYYLCGKDKMPHAQVQSNQSNAVTSTNAIAPRISSAAV